MNWYQVKFAVSGKPDEYVYGDKKIIRIFLDNYYSNSSKYAVSTEDIENSKLIKLDNTSTTDIEQLMTGIMTPYRAVNIPEGIIFEAHDDNGEIVITKERYLLKN